MLVCCRTVLLDDLTLRKTNVAPYFCLEVDGLGENRTIEEGVDYDGRFYERT